MNDTRIYKILRWLATYVWHGPRTFMLWRWRASAEDRTKLKQRVRELERDLVYSQKINAELRGRINAGMKS